ncbi:YtfJ family protein [Odoribacter lunatus]|uniref:YtfJ family protein n=1 Tax=Odoribacter lunatus TaxID=2941335 RepID=UPI00203D3B3E|nr:YtfJ family protein [Odoribacter lunatus]
MFEFVRKKIKKRYFFFLFFVLYSGEAILYAQVGEKVCPIVIYDARNKPLLLPSLGKKHLLLFYVDPDHPSQNKAFRNELKKHPFTDENIESYGIVNLKDAPLLANSLLRYMIRNEIAGTQAYVYNDPDRTLSRAWNLGNVNNKFVVIWINKECVIEFYKAGQLTPEEIKEIYALIKKYKHTP